MPSKQSLIASVVTASMIAAGGLAYAQSSGQSGSADASSGGSTNSQTAQSTIAGPERRDERARHDYRARHELEPAS
jgi:hypothetical protein